MKHILACALVISPIAAQADWTAAPVPALESWNCVATAGAEWHTGTVCIGRFVTTCIQESGVFDSITVAKCTEGNGWNALLNSVYQALREDLSAPDMPLVAAEALRDTQRVGRPFRNAECMSGGNLNTGTARFEDGLDCMLRVTSTRARDLIGYGGRP